ncbi:HupE/UreJ protein [Rhodomicrobium vannielii ATCC 17100]|uniref:HupE/UreJ protein n=1 Tax=Rhodomicrobium vannielii (strain ATCC 17100 / DSM 162 / LMG 4299 / NCIMB 10020 / ATH 3.1.1) TaxID=648757 RepID=E3HZL3_RHOVT|nr:HupE/UreJ family protein [Rhodomicrobium vannielii]ADP71048.1 HupE/UreJ protein [Rhodomicrobium vannielii ATCC 17100]
MAHSYRFGLGSLAAFALCLTASSPAFAHTQVGVAGGFLSGFTHPIFGADHLVAMVAVGLWGAQLGSPAIWVLPIAFPSVMAIGGLFGVLGVPLPMVELLVSGSAVVLGLMVALNARPPLVIAGLIVAAFAIFHGHAHGAELPEAANPLAYGVGFVLATGLLHLCGIIIGLLVAWPMGARLVRGCGVLIACLGCYFVAGWAGAIA